MHILNANAHSHKTRDFRIKVNVKSTYGRAEVCKIV